MLEEQAPPPPQGLTVYTCIRSLKDEQQICTSIILTKLKYSKHKFHYFEDEEKMPLKFCYQLVLLVTVAYYNHEEEK